MLGQMTGGDHVSIVVSYVAFWCMFCTYNHLSSLICYRLGAMSQRIMILSSKPLNVFFACIMWIMFFLLPGVSLAITPFIYEYLYFPYNVLAVALILGNGFFRAVMRHRIPGVRFIWPNPSSMGALVSGVILTVTCAVTYFPCILLSCL